MAYYVGLDVSLKTTAISWWIAIRISSAGIGGHASRDDSECAGPVDRLCRADRAGDWLVEPLAGAGAEGAEPAGHRDRCAPCGSRTQGPTGEDDRADARALAEMLQSGWYTEVFVKSEESHRMKALLSARDQLVRNKRTFFGQIRGMLRPFGIRLPARQGTRKFDEAARAACRHDDLLYACVNALLEALGAIEAQIAALDKRVRAMVQTSKAC